MYCRRYDSDRIGNLPVGESLVTATYTSTSSSSRQDVNASYVDEPVLLIDRTAAGSVGAGTDERFYYHRNQQYSITALTDNTGVVQERYAYTAYGEPTILDGVGTVLRTTSFIGNPYLYTAQEYDAETALYHFNARMYEGRKGRFLSHDLILYPDGANTYKGWFATRRTDSMGLAECGDCPAKTYNEKTHCCENKEVVPKVKLRVVIRDEGVDNGVADGHLDIVIPGVGLVGFFGRPDPAIDTGPTTAMPGYMIVSATDWITGDYEHYADGSYVSTICEKAICPNQAKLMANAAEKKILNPPDFVFLYSNCAMNGTHIVRAGIPNFPVLINPEGVKLHLRKDPTFKCYRGTTKVDTLAIGAELTITNKDTGGTEVEVQPW